MFVLCDVTFKLCVSETRKVDHQKRESKKNRGWDLKKKSRGRSIFINASKMGGRVVVVIVVGDGAYSGDGSRKKNRMAG